MACARGSVEGCPTVLRTHEEALESLSQLLAAYALSSPTFERDREPLTSADGFPTQPD